MRTTENIITGNNGITEMVIFTILFAFIFNLTASSFAQRAGSSKKPHTLDPAFTSVKAEYAQRLESLKVSSHDLRLNYQLDTIIDMVRNRLSFSGPFEKYGLLYVLAVCEGERSKEYFVLEYKPGERHSPLLTGSRQENKKTAGKVDTLLERPKIFNSSISPQTVSSLIASQVVGSLHVRYDPIAQFQVKDTDHVLIPFRKEILAVKIGDKTIKYVEQDGVLEKKVKHNSKITSFISTADYLLIGDEDGNISSYDGVSITLRKDCLFDSPVTALAVDSNRNVFIGRKNGAVEMWDSNFSKKVTIRKRVEVNKKGLKKSNDESIHTLLLLNNTLFAVSKSGQYEHYSFRKSKGIWEYGPHMDLGLDPESMSKFGSYVVGLLTKFGKVVLLDSYCKTDFLDLSRLQAHNEELKAALVLNDQTLALQYNRHKIRICVRADGYYLKLIHEIKVSSPIKSIMKWDEDGFIVLQEDGRVTQYGKTEVQINNVINSNNNNNNNSSLSVNVMTDDPDSKIEELLKDPDQYVCPIEKTLIEEPSQGANHFYEYDALKKWVSKYKNDPLTREEILPEKLSVDLNMINEISKYRKERIAECSKAARLLLEKGERGERINKLLERMEELNWEQTKSVKGRRGRS